MPRVVTVRALSNYWKIYLFVLPSVLLVALFSYYPAVSAMFHAFYRWNGEDINYFIGDRNFHRLLGNYWPWIAVYVMFYATLISSAKDNLLSRLLLLASGILSPLIAIAVLLKAELAFSKIFGFSPASVGILVTGAVLAGILYASILIKCDRDDANKRAYSLMPLGLFILFLIRSLGFDTVFAGIVSILILGIILWMPRLSAKFPNLSTIRSFQSFTALSFCFWALASHGGGDVILWSGFGVISILIAFNVVKMIPSILTAVVINRLKSEKMNYFYRVLFVIPMIIPGMVYLLLWKFFFEPNIGIFNQILSSCGIMDALIWLDVKLDWGGVFKAGVQPVWLGNESLVIPAFIIWGFPWVGVVGVLIYLAGLQQIDKSVYEAADIDGAGPIQKFFNIELPLILTQVRINMVLMIIGTIQSYSFVLILFGTDGGPNGKLMIPGLYMFRSAFREGYAGYACAIGLILFFFILLLTEFNNRYLKVDK